MRSSSAPLAAFYAPSRRDGTADTAVRTASALSRRRAEDGHVAVGVDVHGLAHAVVGVARLAPHRDTGRLELAVERVDIVDPDIDPCGRAVRIMVGLHREVQLGAVACQDRKTVVLKPL